MVSEDKEKGPEVSRDKTDHFTGALWLGVGALLIAVLGAGLYFGSPPAVEAPPKTPVGTPAEPGGLILPERPLPTTIAIRDDGLTTAEVWAYGYDGGSALDLGYLRLVLPGGAKSGENHAPLVIDGLQLGKLADGPDPKSQIPGFSSEVQGGVQRCQWIGLPIIVAEGRAFVAGKKFSIAAGPPRLVILDKDGSIRESRELAEADER